MNRTLYLLRELAKDDVDFDIFLQLDEDNGASKLAKIINRLTIGIIIAGLFIGSSMLSLSSMEPRLLGVPVLAFFGYLGAAVLSVWVVFDISKRKL